MIILKAEWSDRVDEQGIPVSSPWHLNDTYSGVRWVIHKDNATPNNRELRVTPSSGEQKDAIIADSAFEILEVTG